MRYADSLLTEGEVIVLRTRQHWLALIVRARAAVGLWLLGIVLLGAVMFFNVAPGVTRDVLSGVALVLIVLGIVIFLYRLWHWSAQDYIVTNRRLLKVTGILNKRSADSSLEKINDAILIQPVLGRMLGYGDLEILTAADQAVDRYHMLNDPKQFKKVMLTQKHALETDYTFSAPPTPPLRAERPPEMAPAPPVSYSAPPQAPAAAPVAQPVVSTTEMAPPPAPAMPDTPAEPTDESLEITQTLARLADLRDSGAITAEEYEQKKDDLLNRL
jgi:hypothetical protein